MSFFSFFLFFPFFPFFVLFFLFFSKQMKKWSSYGYTGVRFKLVKYQHLELILRENKLTYTKLILNVTDSETKIRIELSKAKKKSNAPKKHETLFRAMYPAPVC